MYAVGGDDADGTYSKEKMIDKTKNRRCCVRINVHGIVCLHLGRSTAGLFYYPEMFCTAEMFCYSTVIFIFSMAWNSRFCASWMVSPFVMMWPMRSGAHMEFVDFVARLIVKLDFTDIFVRGIVVLNGLDHAIAVAHEADGWRLVCGAS